MSQDFHTLVIGFIPNDWASDINYENHISVGDAASSNTKEIDFSNEGGVWNFGFEVPEGQDVWFNPKSKLWSLLAEKASIELTNNQSKLDAIKLGKCWSYFNEEILIFSGAVFVAGPNDASDFVNTNNEYNGCFYVAYSYCDNGTHYDERTLVIK